MLLSMQTKASRLQVYCAVDSIERRQAAPQGYKMGFINHHKAEACLELEIAQHGRKLVADSQLRADEYVCIISFAYLANDTGVDCILTQEAGLATNPFDIVSLLLTNLPERENGERY